MLNIKKTIMLIIICLCPSPLLAEASLAGTKGQNYDRVVFENATDEAVEVVARVMTINRHPDSASTVVVTDNGAPAFGPESDGAERWKRTILVKGKGRHELVMLCQTQNAEPVYCALNVNDKQVSLLQP